MIGKLVSRLSAAALLACTVAAGPTFAVPISVTTVGQYSPGVVGGPTNNDALSNSALNGITLANFQTLMTGAFASNTGGVVNFEPSTGWVTSNGTAATAFGAGPTDPINVTFGADLTNQLNYWRSDIDPATLGPAAVDASNNNGTNVVSGTHYMGLRVLTEPVNLTFGSGLSAVGLTVVPRGALRTVTMSALLDDATLVAGTPETITAANTPGAYFFGFQAPAGRTIVGLRINTPAGFSRFDDLGFVVAGVPEPSSAALLGLGVVGLIRKRRQR